jgi:hypothetical protein
LEAGDSVDGVCGRLGRLLIAIPGCRPRLIASMLEFKLQRVPLYVRLAKGPTTGNLKVELQRQTAACTRRYTTHPGDLPCCPDVLDFSWRFLGGLRGLQGGKTTCGDSER